MTDYCPLLALGLVTLAAGALKSRRRSSHDSSQMS